jgi:hypothetical protein
MWTALAAEMYVTTSVNSRTGTTMLAGTGNDCGNGKILRLDCFYRSLPQVMKRGAEEAKQVMNGVIVTDYSY